MKRKLTWLSLSGLVLLQAFASVGISAQVVQGRLTDMDAGTPVELGRVTLLDAGGKALRITLTDGGGYYLLAAPEPGEYWLRAEAAFHEALSDGPISLTPTDTVWLDYQIEPRPVELDALEVTARGRSPRLEREGVYDRMHAHVGQYFDEKQLGGYLGDPVSKVISRLPMVELRPDTTVGGNAVGVLFRRRQFPSLRGDGASPLAVCYPQIFLNGILMSTGGKYPAGLDRFSSNDLAAIEVYEDPAFLPTRFRGRHEGCGTIVLWSR